MSDRPRGRARRSLSRLRRASTSRAGRTVMAVGSVLFGLAVVGLAVRHLSNTPMPFTHGRPTFLVSVGLLFIAAFMLKASGWARLFHARERPGPVSLAAAGGGATIMGIVLPGRFDELVRIAIVRRFPGCPAGIPTICF